MDFYDMKILQYPIFYVPLVLQKSNILLLIIIDHKFNLCWYVK